MRTRFAAAALTAAAALSFAVPSAATAAEPSIIGGSTAPSVSWGAQVYVNTPGRDFQGFNCSGTVIAPDWVMTAVHCLDQDGSGMFVRVGTNTLYGGTKIAVDREEQSPNGDIALLHLAQSTSAGPISLGSSDPSNGSTNQLYGWGRTTPSGPPASALKVANVKVTGRSTDAYGGRAIQSVGIDGSAWKGDSGGPELSGGAQVGVASTVQNQSGSNTRGTNNYASVASSRSWIRSTAGV
ncbi:S1 family peptidase [Amycolatopsis rubida]|uniref:Trypsin n=1 Tax=Amycolatopsis rubida TaxID=112413 RepID=A0A1I5QAG7_9PSEU|nr:trypsin-like serine protease [Amycolatopsis rubida]SFP43298.1 Trypsin [Amycolatopsis rubida]